MLRMSGSPASFAEFWPSYVLAHRQVATRIFHTIGTLAGWTLLISGILLRRPWWILAALVVPYALAWFSHFFVEHNRPATFGHPLWSWLADQRMVALVVTGKMEAEVRRCEGIESRASAV
jgi:hypothetical protein